MGGHPHHKGHKMPPVVVFIGEQRFKDLQRIGQPARQSQVRTVAPVQGWTQATNELPGHPTTEDVAGSHDPCAGTSRARAVPFMGNLAGFPLVDHDVTGFRLVDDDVHPQGLAGWACHKGGRRRTWAARVFRPSETRWRRVVPNPSRLTGLSNANKPAKNDIAKAGNSKNSVSDWTSRRRSPRSQPKEKKRCRPKQCSWKTRWSCTRWDPPVQPRPPRKWPPCCRPCDHHLPFTAHRLIFLPLLKNCWSRCPSVRKGRPWKRCKKRKKKTRWPGIFHPHHPTATTPRLRKGCLMPCYLDVIPSTSMTTTLTRQVLHRTSVPFTTAFTPPPLQTRLGVCPLQPCAVFLDEKAAPTLLDQLRRQKHPQLMAGRGTTDDPRPPLMCFCNEPLALRVSRTAQNPERLFLGCKSQKCRFFQGTDQPWSPTLCDRWAQVLRHLSS